MSKNYPAQSVTGKELESLLFVHIPFPSAWQAVGLSDIQKLPNKTIAVYTTRDTAAQNNNFIAFFFEGHLSSESDPCIKAKYSLNHW